MAIKLDIEKAYNRLFIKKCLLDFDYSDTLDN